MADGRWLIANLTRLRAGDDSPMNAETWERLL
jgi:hypothetical protein